MTTRALGPGAGWDWVRRAVNLGSSNPMAIFGGAALFLLVIIVLAVGLGLVMGGLTAAVEPGVAGSFAMSLLITLPVLLVAACLTVGYLRLVHAVETGQPASAGDLFKGFGDMQVSLRAIGFMVLLAVAQNVIMFGLISAVAPDMASFYMQSMQLPTTEQGAAQMPTLPDGFGLFFAVLWLVGLLAYAIQAIGIGQIALNERGVGGAIGDGLSGTFKNVLPLVVLLAVAIVAAIALVIVGFLAILLIGLLAKLLGMWIGFVIGVPLYIALVLVMVVVAFGVMYHMWRDVCGGDAAVPTLAENQVEL